MPSRPLPPPLPASFVYRKRTDALANAHPLTSDVHPGWVRASQIILRGLARLEALEKEAGQQETE